MIMPHTAFPKSFIIPKTTYCKHYIWHVQYLEENYISTSQHGFDLEYF